MGLPAFGDKTFRYDDKNNDKNIRYNIEQFLSEEDRWVSSVDRLIAFLRGKDREFGHLLTLANGVLPGGPRFETCLASGRSSPDSASLLAGKLLADMADFITQVLDPSFALVRYAESLNTSVREFSRAAESRNGYILRTFYRPFLEAEWRDLDRFIGGDRIAVQNSNAAGSAAAAVGGNAGGRFLLGITIPFAGCLAGALACAESAKQYFGDRVVTAAGGGYVNTELRFMRARSFFDFFDYLSFDRGYGSLEAIMEHLGKRENPGEPEEPVLYKTLYRSQKTGGLIGSPDEAPGSRGWQTDQEAARTVFPDYRGLDFSRYLYPVDDTNPMFRLWTDGHWLKAYLAHGCYWHNCAFCDTGLDYIRGFRPVDPEALFRHLLDQAEQTGVRGVHLVDEAAPVPSLIRLAELNREAGLPLIFWGNIRFENGFSPDAAALLAAGGLVGVSGGIEIPTEAGFKRLGKGIGLREVVRSCAAFKEQGILTHGYLIYGYWDQSAREIVDSAEILRQLFAEGLLDSAFWHRFVLTRHSRLYAEWRRGEHPGLTVPDRIPEADSGVEPPGELFGYNDLPFAGEDRFDPFGETLDRLLASWMAGEGTDSPVEGAFPFAVPAPAVSPRTVVMLLDAYARDRDRARDRLPGEDPAAGQDRRPGAGTERLLFLGSHPIRGGDEKTARLRWRWRLGDHRLRITGPGAAGRAAKTAALLEDAARGSGRGGAAFFEELAVILGRDAAAGVWKKLRRGGLILL
jgi:hypothetical protein